MSIAEFHGHADQDYPSQLDRTPPSDYVAEQSVLGAMLLSKDAIADVVEVVRGTDFYRPAHETLYDAVIDLYGRGEPADAITVSAELQRQGELARVGGAPYLHTLVSGVPIAANAGYYAEIVREKAILRRLVDAGTRIAQMGYAAQGEVDDVVDRAQAEVYGVTEKRSSEDYAPLAEIMEGALDEIEAIGNRNGEMIGVPTGFSELDELTNGLHPGQMVVIAARPAMGKALALDTPLPAPVGWTTMGEVAVGDSLLGADGLPTRVVAATEVMLDRACYRVHFSDGSSIVADAEHLWSTRTPGVSGARLSTTARIALSMTEGVVHQVDDERKISEVERVASVPVRCLQTDAEDQLFLAGPTMVPTHNSTLALDFARAASIRHGLATVIFSLEMTRNEITMRLLSAEGRIPLHHMRNGHMSDDDWQRLARKMGEVSSAPLFIDDSPNMTLTEIRAKARRLKQRNGLRMIVIDYLQLMTSGKKVESRQIEVSEFSRQLKLIAKELEVPVVALSQLNRGAEQRSDKRPMLSDLRESGCMTADTTLLRADTGAPVSFAELMADGHEGVLVWSFDEQRRLTAAPITKVFPSGVKQVYRLRLASGREVKATANHPFLGFEGWQRLDSLQVGGRIAIPRRTPEPIGAGLGWSEQVLESVAQSVGEGRVAGVPSELHSASDAELAVFLRRLLEVAGCDGGTVVELSSRGGADDVLRLLTRFGIVGRLAVGSTSVRVVVAEDRLRDVLGEASHPAPGGGRCVDSVDDAFWDEVVGIEAIGERPVYDATVKGTHNFIADGIAAHNSIEQDADMVILLHRDDAYEKESLRPGEADLVVAKHRNGPTKDVVVAFQGHYSRFVDMAH